MPTVIETTVYKFDELSDEAKQKARDWWREASASDNDNYFAEHVTEDFREICQRIGIQIDKQAERAGENLVVGLQPPRRRRQLRGAMVLSARARFRRSKNGHLRTTDFLAIANSLHVCQRRYFYRLAANIRHERPFESRLGGDGRRLVL